MLTSFPTSPPDRGNGRSELHVQLTVVGAEADPEGVHLMTQQLIGRTFVADLGPLQTRLTFNAAGTLTFVVTKGAGLAPDGHTETVDVQVSELRPDLYLASWREASGATVTHVEDLANSVLHS